MNVRSIEITRCLWGTALLVAPRGTLWRLPRVNVDRRAVAVTRILGARHIAQATLSGVEPSPEVLAAGVWVDAVHSITAVGLAAVDPHRAQGATIDAVVAAAWAVFGWRDLTTGKVPRRDRQQRRDQLARMMLALLPGGKPLLARAEQARASQAGAGPRAANL